MATTGGRVLLSVLTVLGVSSLVGCGKAQKSFNKKSNGVIVQTQSSTQEEVQALFPGNKVSVVSSEDHIYQIKDAELLDVQARMRDKMPGAVAEEDILVNMLDPNFNIHNRSNLSLRASIEKTLINLGCVEAPFGGPQVRFELVSDNNLVAQNTVEVGIAPSKFEATLVSAAKTAATSSVPSIWDPLKGFLKNSFETASVAVPLLAQTTTIQWVVEAPPGSKTLAEAKGNKISVTPDMPGGYIVAVIAQDTKTKVCDLTGGMIGATQNKKYLGKTGAGTKGTQGTNCAFAFAASGRKHF